MKIPASFQCGGRTITVERTTYLSDRHGEWVSSDDHIRVQKASSEREELIFFHEFFHAALETYGKHDLSADEELVDLLAQAIVQLRKTSK